MSRRTSAPDPALFEAGVRHLVVLAHQDDELPYAGLLSRLPDAHVVFVTNGDGLHFELDMEPAPYARLRHEESRRALAAIGIGDERTTWLDGSELDYYAEFGRMSERADSGPLSPLFEETARRVAEVVERVQPDVVWTMAYQGGNPEHDLTHLCARRAARAHRERTGREVPLFEFPAYELMVVVMRFPPWYDGERFVLELDASELATKRAMFEMYPTQKRVIDELSRAVRAAGALQRLRGRRWTLDDFARFEHFGRVPEARDYTRSTHRTPLLDYPMDDWKGQRIRFERTLARIAREWKALL